jgi:hypothetical protein
MHPLGCFHNSFRTFAGLAVVALVASPASAVLVHKYTFNANNANDTGPAAAHGTIVDNTGIHTFTGGALNLSANGTGAMGAGSNQDFTNPATVGAYVDLPNDIFTAAVQNGTYGQITLETWFTVQENRTWAELATFGTSNSGENNVSTGAGAQSYVAIIPQSGPGDFRVTTKSPSVETPLIGGPPLTPNQKHHVVMVLDQLDTDGGANLNGTATLYLNNGAPVRQPIQPLIDTMTNNNNWLGRSQWPDPLFDGLIDEFRIYDHALTAGDVATSFTAGPEPAPLPVLVVNRDTGAISLANQSAGNIQIKGYSITSAAGSLNPATWQSIDTGNGFDPNGTWTTSSLTNLDITESNTGGTLDGGTLAPSTTRGIGTPWLKTPFQDLAFSFTLGDNSTATGQIQYTGSAAVRSDLNGDSDVTAADWAIFVPNSYSSLAGLPAAQAYLKGDLDGDLDNDFNDYRLFKTDFIAANGEAAFAALAGAVPEPTSALLLTAALVGLTTLRRRS